MAILRDDIICLFIYFIIISFGGGGVAFWGEI